MLFSNLDLAYILIASDQAKLLLRWSIQRSREHYLKKSDQARNKEHGSDPLSKTSTSHTDPSEPEATTIPKSVSINVVLILHERKPYVCFSVLTEFTRKYTFI